MKILCSRHVVGVALLLFSLSALADQAFVIQKIQVEGASAPRVLRYLSLKAGQTLQPQDTATIISTLYQTGFFSDIQLSRQGNILIIKVAERPVISSVKVTGNSVIASEQINSALKEVGLVSGKILDKSVLQEVTNSLQSAYAMQGFYNARITPTLTPVGQHRIAVKLQVSEGRVALVEKIHIIGNQIFNEKILAKQLTLTTPQWDSWVTRADHYSEANFQASLEKLGQYYLDRGYLHFKIDSANAVLNPDRQSVTLVIHVTEGSPYKLSGYRFSGNTILPLNRYEQEAAFKKLTKGAVFSRQQVLAASDTVQGLLADQGYAFANVDLIPKINEVNKTVFVTFQVDAGSKVYVRNIRFRGNTSTEDNVLRSAIPQPEGGVYTGSAVKESLRRLNLLGYFQQVDEKTEPVAGSANQVDLNYKVSEQPSAQAMLSAGYGSDGLVFGASVNEANFLGTGKQVGINFNRSQYQRSYSFNYNNPYYTPQGVQRGFSFYNTHTDPAALNLSSYTYNNYGANLFYSIPFTANDAYQLGIGVQRTQVNPGTNASLQIDEFVHRQGTTFNQTLLTAGWSRNSLDRALFPRQGITQNFNVEVSAPLVARALDFYKVSYQAHAYHPLAYGFIAGASTALGYGNGYGNTKGLPFFSNYYAGGLGVPGQVRGFDTNTLGPKDSTGAALGGNVLTAASMQLILPHPLSAESVRTSVFVDAGNVFLTGNPYHQFPPSDQGLHFSQLRYSTGLDIQWRVPVLNGVLEFALAKPFHVRKYDQKQFFSFNIGGNL